MVSTRRSGSLSGNNSKRSSSSEDNKPQSPKRQKVVFLRKKKTQKKIDSFVGFHFLVWEGQRFGFLGGLNCEI